MGGNPDPPRPTLALSPDGKWAAVALGGRVVCLDRGAGTAATAPGTHAGPVRALAFSPAGTHLVSGGDDKAVIVREAGQGGATAAAAPSWPVTSTWAAPKKVSAVALLTPRPASARLFSLAGDKFGDILAAEVGDGKAGGEEAAGHACCGHFCTIVTSLAHAPPPPGLPPSDPAGGGWLASADGGGRARVSPLPADPTAHAAGYGIPEALAFCAGHTAFVTGLAWCGVLTTATPPASAGGADADADADADAGAPPSDPPYPLSPPPSTPPPPGLLLATASGDGSVRLWRPADGALLATHWATPAAAAHAAARSRDRAGIAARLAAKRAAAARAFAACSNGGGKEEEEEAEAAGGGEGGDDAPAADWSRPDGVRRPPPPAVVALAASPDGATLAAVVEGEDAVQLLTVTVTVGGGGGGGSLARAGALTLPRVPRPTAVAWDPAPSPSGGAVLWGVGLGEGAAPGLVLGAASVGGGAEGGPPALPAPAVAAVEAAAAAATAADAAAAPAGAPPLPPTRDQINLEMRRTAANGEPRLDPRVLEAEAAAENKRAKVEGV